MSKFGKYLKVAWTYFNGWRKKYWLTRTLIILLIFSPILYEKLRGHLIICDLVKIACDSIFYGSIPKAENALCKYYKIVEIKRLQTSIIVYADINQNGTLDVAEIEFLKSKGCNTEEIQKMAINADMDKLADDAGRIGLLPPAYSTTQIRRNAFNAAHSETEFAFNPMKDEVYDLIGRMNWLYPKLTEKQMNELKLNSSEGYGFKGSPITPDLSSWKTWTNGFKYVLYGFTSTFGPLVSTVLWFSISILLGLFSAITFKSYRKSMSVLVSLIFLSIMLYLNGNFPTSLANYTMLTTRTYYLSALVIFSIVAGLTGFKISRSIQDKTKWRILTPLIIGFLMILWSLNLDFLFKEFNFLFSWGIGSLICPITATQSNSFSQNLATFATIFILVYLGFLYIFYQNVVSDFLCKLKRRDK
jgi:hypothetical protein